MASKAERQALYQFIQENLGTLPTQETLSQLLPGATMYNPDEINAGNPNTFGSYNEGGPLVAGRGGYNIRIGDVGAMYDAQGNLANVFRHEPDSGMMKLMRTAMPALAIGALGGAAFAPQLLGGTAATTAAAPISSPAPTWVAGATASSPGGMLAGAPIGASSISSLGSAATLADYAAVLGQSGGIGTAAQSALSRLGGNMAFSWTDLIKPGIDLVGGMFSNRAAQNTAQQQVGLSREQDAQRQAAQLAYGDRLGQIPRELASGYQFRPVTSRSAFGTSGFDPTTGEAYSNMSPELAAQAAQFGNLGKAEYDQIAGLDRNAMAQGRFDQLQALLGRSDEQSLNTLMNKMNRTGMLGLTSATGTTGTPANPYLAEWSSGIQDRDLKMALGATDWVEQNIQNRMSNMTGMYGQQRGVYDDSTKPMGAAQQWSEAQYKAQFSENQVLQQMLTAQAQAYLNAGLPGDLAYQAAQQALATQLQGTQGLISGAANAASIFAGGMFGQPPAPISNSRPSTILR